MAESRSPPVAKKVEHVMEMFGDVRIDNYYWLRDDSRCNPDVISYLREENDYTDSVMSGTKEFENQLFSEIRGRIEEDDISPPRRKDAPLEHVILDENIKAQAHEYYRFGAFQTSPDHKLVAYAEDTKGDEIHTVHVADSKSREPVGQPLKGVTCFLEWAGNDALVYITMNGIMRPDKVWLHKLGTEQGSDVCLYHEKDDMFSLDLQPSESQKYIFVGSESKTTRFVFSLDVSKPQDGIRVLTPRVVGIDSSVSHRGNHFFIQRRSTEFYNSELVACSVDDTSKITILLPHRENVKIQEIQLFRDHLAVFEREQGLQKITVHRLPAEGQPLERLQDGRSVSFVDPVYSINSADCKFSSKVLKFCYSSMKTPPSVYEYDMDSGTSVVKNIDTVLGVFDASNYVTERKWVTASDGTQIPMSIAYNKNLAKLDGSDPLLLYGYGAYETSSDPCFKASRLSLLDRGLTFVIAHIRGGGEMGRQWYENGKLLKKKNTFTDFIDCAEYLIEYKYCSKEKLCIQGKSAGGLLMGAVVNMRPDLFKLVIAGAPFVDVLTTMLDPTIPLTTSEWEEWGDPSKEEYYSYMKSYSPVDNVTAQNYPNMLVTAGLHDARVIYSEPAKWVAKLREMKTDNNILLFKCELGAGHFLKSGRFEKLQEDAFTFAFMMKVLDMIPASG